MVYLLQISLDNSRRLVRKRYLFEYRGIRFKLVQDNPRRHPDHLLTIVPPNDRAAEERAFAAAAEFASALAWENGAQVAVWLTGAAGLPDDYPLTKAEPNISSLPKIPFSGHAKGFDLKRLPNVQTQEQRLALGLFREANASNNDYLSFLFYWQVLTVGGGQKPEHFVDHTYRKHRARLLLSQDDMSHLPLGGRSLGTYLRDDCRDAIAHIRRSPGKKNLDLDKPDERNRLVYSTRVIKVFAQHYIRENLHLTEHLYLVRRKRGDFPVFADSQTIESCNFIPAYPWRTPRMKQTRLPAR